MKNIVEVKAQSRDNVGKQVAKRIRREGKIPAIIYGEKKDSIPISIDLEYVKKILKAEMGENTILKIKRDKVEVDAMLKNVQYDYLSSTIIHADFIRIDLKKKIDISVPIILVGEPIGVRIEDGILDFVNREVDIRCLPANIPSKFEIDVTDIHVGNSLKFEIIELDEDAELLSSPGRVICAVSLKGSAEEEEVAEEEELEEGEEGVDEDSDEEKSGKGSKEDNKPEDKKQ